MYVYMDKINELIKKTLIDLQPKFIEEMVKVLQGKIIDGKTIQIVNIEKQYFDNRTFSEDDVKILNWACNNYEKAYKMVKYIQEHDEKMKNIIMELLNYDYNTDFEIVISEVEKRYEEAIIEENRECDTALSDFKLLYTKFYELCQTVKKPFNARNLIDFNNDLDRLMNEYLPKIFKKGTYRSITLEHYD